MYPGSTGKETTILNEIAQGIEGSTDCLHQTIHPCCNAIRGSLTMGHEGRHCAPHVTDVDCFRVRSGLEREAALEHEPCYQFQVARPGRIHKCARRPKRSP